MTTATKTAVCATAALVAAGLALVGHREARSQEARLVAIAAEHARLQQEIEALKAASSTPPDADPSSSAGSRPSARDGASAASLAGETSAWLERYQRLKAAFAARLDQRIPEMDLLTDRDYLMCARDASFLTEESTRQALAATRTTAKQKFVRSLATAVKDYRNAHSGQPPAQALELAPFLAPPLTAQHLERWEVLPPRADGRTVDLMTEKLPVDPDHDTRVRLQTSGGISVMGAPLAWIPDYADRARAAQQAFARAHSGASATSAAALIPYFAPPLDEASVRRIRDYEARPKQRK